MRKTTKIEWTDHPFNPWWGCVKVSPGCDHCYAETDAKRYGKRVWGKDADRRFLGDDHWAKPVQWNREAEQAGERCRVFNSMCDVFEDHRRDLDPHRERLWQLVRETPWLDWQLLTKRADAIHRLLPADIRTLPNVWLGVSIEDPDYLRRVEKLLQIECAGPRWVSYEPALAAVDFRPYLGPGRLEWVIVGGESGWAARPFDLAWAADSIAACRAAGVAPFVKQLGTVWAETFCSRSSKGGEMLDWPKGLRVREWPRHSVAAVTAAV